MSKYADLISKMYNVRDAGSCEDQAAEPGCDLGKEPDKKRKNGSASRSNTKTYPNLDLN